MAIDLIDENEPIAALLKVLDLDDTGDDTFTGHSMNLGWQRIYGGQVIAQALIAGHRTVDENRFIHSLHCYFLRPGDPSEPITFEVDRLRDGGSFSARHVRAVQKGRAILTLSASFKIEEDGLTHQAKMPKVKPVEELPDIPALMSGKLSYLPEQIKSYWLKRRPMELRPISLDHYTTTNELPPEQTIWIRAVMGSNFAAQHESRVTAAAVLAYMSDMTLLDTSLFAHGKSIFDPQIQIASIDHAMWFHRAPDLQTLADWLLYDQHSPATARGCGSARGNLFARNGDLLATTAQEGLIRLHEERANSR
jgi:acyl-CoA thioesterase-2